MEKAAMAVARRVIPPVVQYVTRQAQRAFNYFHPTSANVAPAPAAGNINNRVVIPTTPAPAAGNINNRVVIPTTPSNVAKAKPVEPYAQAGTTQPYRWGPSDKSLKKRLETAENSQDTDYVMNKIDPQEK